MKYRISENTPGKLIEVNFNQQPQIRDWVVRKNLEFSNSLIDSTVIKTKIERFQKTPIGILSKEHKEYALFGGDSGGDRRAKYILAIPYYAITLVP